MTTMYELNALEIEQVSGGSLVSALDNLLGSIGSIALTPVAAAYNGVTTFGNSVLSNGILGGTLSGIAGGVTSVEDVEEGFAKSVAEVVKTKTAAAK